jgi:AraC-like DNA-binding protein
LRATLHRTDTDTLPFSFVRLLEARLGRLSPPVATAVQDAFERPQIYDNVSDLARTARVRVRSLFRELEKAGLGTPKKLLAVARVLRGVSYMQSGSLPLATVSAKLRYSDPRVFREAIISIFGCSPNQVRKYCSDSEALLHVSEWLYKPTGQRVRNRFQAS